ncbi:MAG: TenA family protein [Sphingomonadaceae bacterium]
MPAFSADAWAANAARYAAILALPFNRELADGSLAAARFREYMIQDAHYLEGFARALALLAARAPDAGRIVQFAQAASEAILVERSLHADMFRRFGVADSDFRAAEPSPVCAHYVRFLVATCATADWPVGLAAVLPCFWVYREVGHHIHGQARADNPYRAWIDTYAGEAFALAVDAVIAATDEAAAGAAPSTRLTMHAAFADAVRLEWMFWDSAWREARWPV